MKTCYFCSKKISNSGSVCENHFEYVYNFSHKIQFYIAHNPDMWATIFIEEDKNKISLSTTSELDFITFNIKYSSLEQLYTFCHKALKQRAFI